MKIITTILFLLIAMRSNSQDTIYLVNKAIIVAKISEINSNDIKYNRFDNLTGPLYIENKANIKLIKFSNGHVDTLNYSATPLVNTIENSPKKIKVNEDLSDPTKIEILPHNRLAYNHRGLGERKFKMLIDNFPSKDGTEKLLNEWGDYKRYKTGQYVSGFLGLGLGVGAPIVGLNIAFNQYNMNNNVQQSGEIIAGSILTGIITGITGAIISGVYKHKRTLKKIEIAELYNSLR